MKNVTKKTDIRRSPFKETKRGSNVIPVSSGSFPSHRNVIGTLKAMGIRFVFVVQKRKGSRNPRHCSNNTRAQQLFLFQIFHLRLVVRHATYVMKSSGKFHDSVAFPFLDISCKTGILYNTYICIISSHLIVIVVFFIGIRLCYNPDIFVTVLL